MSSKSEILAEAVLNVFCPTGPGGGIKPNCGSKSGAAQGGRKVVEKTLSQLFSKDDGTQTYMSTSVVYKGKQATVHRDLFKPDTYHITVGHKLNPPPKATGTYKGTYMRYTTVTRKGSEKVHVEVEG